MTVAAADPSLAVDSALRALHGADGVEWRSNFAPAFRQQLERIADLVVVLRYRVENAEASLNRRAPVT